MLIKHYSILIAFVTLFSAVQAQKGAKSISIGPVLCFPVKLWGYERHISGGLGFGAIGQYNFSNRSVALLQFDLTFHHPNYFNIDSINKTVDINISSLAAGYRYRFGGSGFFANVVAGITKFSYVDYPNNSYVNSLMLFGAGKHFEIFDGYFIDAGIEYGGGDLETRLNIKATFSVLRRPKR
jgi:hypothetical protein